VAFLLAAFLLASLQPALQLQQEAFLRRQGQEQKQQQERVLQPVQHFLPFSV
jgi:hypothetical protein